MQNKASKEIMQQVYNHYQQGKSVNRISGWLKLKGIEVCNDTIRNWIRAEKERTEQETATEEKEMFARSEKKAYIAAIKHQRHQQHLFDSIQTGDTITAKIIVYRLRSDGSTMQVQGKGILTVIDKYRYFLRAKQGNKIFCIDKMDICSVEKREK